MGDTAAQHGTTYVAHRGDTRECATQIAAVALDEGLVGIGRTSTGLDFDRITGEVRLEAALGAATTQAATRLDDHVSDVSGVAETPVDQAAPRHDSPADSGADHHRDEVVDSASRTDPSLGHRESLGIVVDVRGESGDLGHRSAQSEVSPRRNVQRRDIVTFTRHRTAARDAARDHIDVSGRRLDTTHEGRQCDPRLTLRRGDTVATNDGSVGENYRSGHLGSTDIDGKDTGRSRVRLPLHALKLASSVMT